MGLVMHASLYGKALPAKCSVGTALVKILCRHYPVLKRLSFGGVSQALSVSQTGYMTRRKFDQDFTAPNPSV